MIAIAALVLATMALGVALERKVADARPVARFCLNSLLYVLVPFVAYVSFAHLRLTLDAGLGLALGVTGTALAGFAAYLLGTRWLALPRPVVGAMICAVVVSNTGNLGLPLTLSVLGPSRLGQAVAYDQVVNAPMIFIVAFAVAAAFGSVHEGVGARRLAGTIARNPPLLAAIAGLLAPPEAAPAVLVSASHFVVYLMLVVGFLSVGISLSTERREDQASLFEPPNGPVGVAIFLRFTVAASVLGLGALAGLAIPVAFMLQAVMPSGVNSLMVAHRYGLDQRFAATAIAWSTVGILFFGVIVTIA